MVVLCGIATFTVSGALFPASDPAWAIAGITANIFSINA